MNIINLKGHKLFLGIGGGVLVIAAVLLTSEQDHIPTQVIEESESVRPASTVRDQAGDYSRVDQPQPEQYHEPLEIVSITKLSRSEDTSDHFRRIVVELSSELNRLEKADDASRIVSRLRPVVQKMYYLKRQSDRDAGQQTRLPLTFQPIIHRMEEQWTNNPQLARTVDDLFHDMDLLECEHLPYQLRNELQLAERSP